MTRISSGTLAAKGHFSLDKDVHDAVAKSIALKEAKEQKTKDNREEKERKAAEKFQRIKSKVATLVTLTIDD